MEFWLAFDFKTIDIRIPKYPHRVYSESFISYRDFIGNESRKNSHKTFRAFKEARKFVRALGLKSTSEYHAWASTNKRPIDIPSLPSIIYKNEDWEEIESQ